MLHVLYTSIILYFHSRLTMNRPLKPHDFVCSDHFKIEDYLTAEENVDKRGRQRTKRTLRPFAFPTIFPWSTEDPLEPAEPEL